MVSKEVVISTLKSVMPQIDFDFKYEEDEDIYSARHVTLKGLDDDILLTICISDVHIVYITFTLDKLSPTDETVSALADFNTKDKYLCAYVDEDGFLTMRYFSVAFTEHDVIETISFLIRHFASITDKVKPLTDMTN